MYTDRLQSLDFMRGVAILGVVSFHTFIIFNPNIRLVSILASQGVYGVQPFFFVSALTMCLNWNQRSGEDRPIIKFYIRRFFRIAPPFWLAMIGYLLLDGTGPSSWSPNGISLRHIVLTGTFLHGFWPDTINTIVPGGWSIAVEMTFYAVFPFIVSLGLSSITLLFGAVALYVLNLSVMAPLMNLAFSSSQDREVMSGFLYFQFFNQAPIFLIGMAIFRFITAERSNLLPHVAVTTCWLTFAFLLKEIFHANSSPFFWLIVAVLAVFVATCLSKNISFLPVNRIGQTSYSTYLTHFAIIKAVESFFRALHLDLHSALVVTTALVLTISLCYGCASLLKATVEDWSSLCGRWVIKKLPPHGPRSTVSTAALDQVGTTAKISRTGQGWD